MSAPRMEQRIGRPAPALRPFVERYVGYHFDGLAPGVHVGLPSRHLTCIVALDAPLLLGGHIADAGPVERHDAVLAGLHDAPVGVHHPGRGTGVQLDVTPAGARALFGVPASAVAGLDVELSTFLGPAGAGLPDRLASAPGWTERFAVLDAVLSTQLRRVDDRGGGAHALVDGAWRRIVSSGGTLTVDELADELCYSRRQVTERFRAEIGYGPKRVARIVRFDRARRYVTSASHGSLGRIAAVCGYADHAHLTREWRRFAGSSPTGWLATDELAAYGAVADPG